MDRNLKSILLECLNENIRLEEMVYSQSIIEATVGATGGSVPPPPGITGSSYPVSPVNQGASGSAPSGAGAATPSTTPSKITSKKLPKTTGGVGSGLPGGKVTTPPATDVLQALGLVGGLNIATYTANLLKNAPLGAYGQNWFIKNIANILPKQEALRKEGLGYTKGWAALADTNR